MTTGRASERAGRERRGTRTERPVGGFPRPFEGTPCTGVVDVESYWLVEKDGAPTQTHRHSPRGERWSGSLPSSGTKGAPERGVRTP